MEFPLNRLIPSVSLLSLLMLAASPACARQPNFVFVLVDDLGYMDIGANNPGTFYETPNVDRLAQSGMRFTSGYAANPVCSPTRYSIMTGRYPSRVNATDWFVGRRSGRFLPAPLINHMPLSEVTLAEALRENGYQTAFLGKWHLGPTEKFWPRAQGFEINVGGHNRGSPPGGYFSPFKNPRLEDGPGGQHLTQRLTDEALEILDQFKEKPFLLYLAFYTVHTPLQAPADLVAKYQAKAKKLGLIGKPEFADEEQIWPTDKPRRVRTLQRHATYAAMVETMDNSVGRILDKLEELGIEQDTVVCFMSDNGGLSTSEGSPTSNLPLRGGKGWLYEGGIREPFLVRWPGVTRPGSSCDVPVISTDFFPTILEIAGLSALPDQHQDGLSLVPLLKQNGELTRKDLFWHYPHYSNQGGMPGGAIRRGDYKLIERFEDGRVHLYNLAKDIGEQTDLAEQMPGRVEDMRASLHEWYKEVDARFLVARPDGPQPWRP
jgi:arylsulfatase A-like enzyme